MGQQVGQAVKVLHINGGGDTGGGKSHLVTLLPELRKLHIEAELVVFSTSLLATEATTLDIPVYCLEVQHMMSLTLLRRLRSLLIKLKPDIVHTHGGRANFYGRLAARLAGIPLVVTTIHSHIDLDYSALLPNAWFSAVDKITRGLANHFIVVSQELGTALGKQGVAQGRISVVHNGIAEVTGESPRLRTVFGLQSDPVICAVGRLVHVKRFDVLFKAHAQVIARVPAAKLVLIGEGPLEAKLRRLAGELNIGHAVTFTGYRSDARYLLADADVFVMSSAMEGLPIVLLEALAAKVPVVATAVGGIPEVIVPQANGLLVPPCDECQLADAIILSLAEPLAAAARAEAGQAWVREHATACVMAAKTAGVYRALQQGGGSYA